MLSQRRKRKLIRKSALTAGKVVGYVLTFVLVLAVTLLIMMQIIVRKSEYSKTTFITTVLETGQLKFLAGLALPEDEIRAVVDANKMQEMENAEVDESMITFTGSHSHDGSQYEISPEIEIVEIPGLTYKATLMIVKDPSRVSVATIHEGNGKWPALGVTLSELAERFNATAAINAGLYSSTNNSGGYPFGVVVSNGEIVRNQPQEWPGMVLIGITDKDILQIIDISAMNQADIRALVAERGIRDAVCFQEEASVDNNHFVQLVINKVPRDVSGSGSGLNPRTAIGQREDGAMLLLVTDGRGSSGHAGAAAADLIDIMLRYGAVNAANLDGGSSTCMYYNGEYLQNSVTFYYSQSSWRLPFAFIVK